MRFVKVILVFVLTVLCLFALLGDSVTANASKITNAMHNVAHAGDTIAKDIDKASKLGDKVANGIHKASHAGENVAHAIHKGSGFIDHLADSMSHKGR